MTDNKSLGVFLPASLLLLGLLVGCTGSTPHERLKWKAEDFFTDPGVISLCRAIEKRDVAEIERVVKSGVNINTKGRGNMTPLFWAFPMGEGVFKKMLELVRSECETDRTNTASCFRGGRFCHDRLCHA